MCKAEVALMFDSVLDDWNHHGQIEGVYDRKNLVEPAVESPHCHPKLYSDEELH